MILEKDDSIFFSEAHFQLLFAMEVLKIHSNGHKKFKCIPEFPIYLGDDKYEIDLLIQDLETKEHTIIEFKYKTVNSSSKKNENRLIIKTDLNQDFEPASHLAHDLGRYDVLSDLERTRRIINDKTINVQNGFIVFLTNDHNYWEAMLANKEYKYGTAFSLEDNRKLLEKQLLDWKKPIDLKTGQAIINIANSVGKTRCKLIIISRNYIINWEIYYRIKSCKNNKINLFKILKLEA